MTPSRTLAVGLVLAVALAGCLGGPAGSSPDATTTTPPATTPPATASPTTTTPGDPGSLPTESVVFDHAGIGSALVEGGVEYDPETTTTRRYATVLDDPADLARLNWSLLSRVSPEAAALVNGTDLSNATLLVYQETPASSSPDYRVESVTRTNGTVEVGINDSAPGGTADVTVETVVVRLAGDPPDEVIFRTEDGTTATESRDQ